VGYLHRKGLKKSHRKNKDPKQVKLISMKELAEIGVKKNYL